MAHETPPYGEANSPKQGSGFSGRGFRGGPGTFRGTDYQLRVAASWGLEMLARQLLAPAVEYALTIEPLIGSAKRSEEWDLGLEPPLKVVEAKLRPEAADIRTFTEAAATSDAECAELVFGEGGGRYLKALKTLLDFGAGSRDAEHLARLVDRTTHAEVKHLHRLLGPDPLAAESPSLTTPTGYLRTRSSAAPPLWRAPGEGNWWSCCTRSSHPAPEAGSDGRRDACWRRSRSAASISTSRTALPAATYPARCG